MTSERYHDTTGRDMSYQAVMARRPEIIKAAVGMDYEVYESGTLAFDYEGMMAGTGLTLEDAARIQAEYGVGSTPLVELKALSRLARHLAHPGYGARIFVKDEAANPSGSFKARRAALSVAVAKQRGYKGVITATSGNYGAAVASMAAKAGLPCIVVQECFDSRGIGQPEILEKARKCEALGAEVVQLTVGPELFYVVLRMLEETGYFNASLYTAYGILGVETLGYELVQQCREQTGRDPDLVLATNAGGGNLTGTARGMRKAGCQSPISGVSVDLSGLHMASDTQFNKKSFTTGHTGFGVPFASWPDRSDVPRSAARPLRYMHQYYTVHQGEVFAITQALACVEGLERGPAGNTSLAAAFALAQTMPSDRVIVVQETEYTGAGKHINAQLDFARQNGIAIRFGDPDTEVPGESIVLPETPRMVKARPMDMTRLKTSYLKNALKRASGPVSEEDILFLAAEVNDTPDFVTRTLSQLKED